jgi:hypothetical protein
MLLLLRVSEEVGGEKEVGREGMVKRGGIVSGG